MGTKRNTPFIRDLDESLEDLRDDCIALFLNSKMRQVDITAAGGPTPQTISKWLYKETRFPRYQTIDGFLGALGYGFLITKLKDLEQLRKLKRHERLGIPEPQAGQKRKPTMPPKKGRK